jgi:CubicO group peptidase (beta-lactamase class C family)
MKALLYILLITCLFSCKSKQTKQPIQANTGFNYRTLLATEKQYYDTAFNRMYHALMKMKGFNGEILVAKNGEIVFEAYAGCSHFNPEIKNSATTPIHIASISKTFTAACILRLYSQSKLSLQDNLQKFFPNLPYQGITIQMLLNHRSGLPNYIYFMDTAWKTNIKAINKDVVNFMITQKPLAYAPPDKVFSYCNTNYVLLALIVEQVTATPYPKYMKDSLFAPLGMKNSFVFNIDDTLNYTPSYAYNNKPYLLEKFDCIYGDKNVYSTARDLLLWDNALYQQKFLSPKTLQLAFTPNSNERPSMHNYGLGWRMWGNGKNKVVYHNGWWHGNNASFYRFMNDTVTIIALGNRYNRSTYAAKQFFTLFSIKNIVQLNTEE